MKKIILLILCICSLNTEAWAVVLYIAQTEDPKKAEEILISKDRANRIFLEERRAELKKKHALKKVTGGTVIAEKAVLSDSSLKSKSLLSDSPMDTEVGDRTQKNKGIDGPQQSSQD